MKYSLSKHSRISLIIYRVQRTGNFLGNDLNNIYHSLPPISLKISYFSCMHKIPISLSHTTNNTYRKEERAQLSTLLAGIKKIIFFSCTFMDSLYPPPPFLLWLLKLVIRIFLGDFNTRVESRESSVSYQLCKNR
jgi:hypothetical protein